jgi:hypothetical protein
MASVTQEFFSRANGLNLLVNSVEKIRGAGDNLQRKVINGRCLRDAWVRE